MGVQCEGMPTVRRELSTTNWHLPEGSPATEQQQQGHAPSALQTEPCAAAAADQHPLRGIQGGGRRSVLEGLSAFLDMRCKDWDLGMQNQFLKISSYLKFCSYVSQINHNFPALHGCIHPVLP